MNAIRVCLRKILLPILMAGNVFIASLWCRSYWRMEVLDIERNSGFVKNTAGQWLPIANKFYGALTRKGGIWIGSGEGPSITPTRGGIHYYSEDFGVDLWDFPMEKVCGGWSFSIIARDTNLDHDERGCYMGVVLPYWSLLAVDLFSGCFLWYLISRGAKGQNRLGFCKKCGYDLRGTPNRCPECGTVPIDVVKSEI